MSDESSLCDGSAGPELSCTTGSAPSHDDFDSISRTSNAMRAPSDRDEGEFLSSEMLHTLNSSASLPRSSSKPSTANLNAWPEGAQVAYYLSNDQSQDRYMADGRDRHAVGPLYRWDWGGSGDYRERFWRARIFAACYYTYTLYVQRAGGKLANGVLTFGVDAVYKCPPFPPPSYLTYLEVENYFQECASGHATYLAQYTWHRLLVQSQLLAAKQEISRDQHVIEQASQLGAIVHQRAFHDRVSRTDEHTKSKLSSAPRIFNTCSPTPVQRYAEMQVNAQYQALLRRADPVIAATISHKEQQMGGAESKTAKRWVKGEAAWNRRVYAEQMGWLADGRPPAATDDRSGATELVPGFIPPPGWHLSWKQYRDLCAEGVIPAPGYGEQPNVYCGVMPLHPSLFAKHYDTASDGEIPAGNGNDVLEAHQRLQVVVDDGVTNKTWRSPPLASGRYFEESNPNPGRSRSQLRGCAPDFQHPTSCAEYTDASSPSVLHEALQGSDVQKSACLSPKLRDAFRPSPAQGDAPSSAEELEESSESSIDFFKTPSDVEHIECMIVDDDYSWSDSAGLRVHQ